MKQSYIFSVLCFFILVVSGCIKKTEEIVTPASEISTKTSIKLEALIPNSVTTNVTPTFVPTVNFPFVEQCVNQETQLNKVNTNGNLILRPRSLNNRGYDGTYIFDPVNNQKINLPSDQDIITRPGISPGGNKIAVEVSSVNGGKKYLKIFSSKGEMEKTIEFSSDLGSFWQWHDDNSVIFSKANKISNIKDPSQWNFFLYDLHSKAKKLYITPVFSSYPQGYNVYEIIPNDNLTYLLFSWIGNHPGTDEKNGYDIIDLDQQKTVFSSGADLGAYQVKRPIWYDDLHAIIAMNRASKLDLFIVDVYGNSKRLTYFSDFFDEVEITNWALSPDKQRLGFTAYYKEDGKWDSSLFILDMRTGVSRNICLKGDEIRYPDEENRFSMSDFDGPVWAPDGQHLLIENRFEKDSSQLYWVDLLINSAIPIAKNTQPLGWMGEPK